MFSLDFQCGDGRGDEGVSSTRRWEFGIPRGATLGEESGDALGVSEEFELPELGLLCVGSVLKS